MKKTRVFGGVATLFFIFAACLPAQKTASIIGYRNQQVFVKKDVAYRIGELPSSWRKFNVPAKAVAFHNDDLNATISTDAFCEGSFEDLPLATLTGQLFAGTAGHSIIKEGEFVLDGRGALRTISTGSIDGVGLKFDSVVVKKNNCTIDFVYIAPPENYEGGVKDFEKFYNGFGFNRVTKP